MATFEPNQEEEPGSEKSKKLARVPTTLASIESLTFPLVQEVVLLADYRCKMCQDRVADIVSRLNGEMESLEIFMMEKKVTLTFVSRYSRAVKRHGKEHEEVTPIYKKIINRMFNVTRFLCTSNTST